MILKSIVLRRFIVWIDGCAAKFRSILLSHFYRAIVLASFLSDFRTRLITETDEIGGTVKNVAFRKIKTSKCTTNTSAEFCRAANKHVSSVKPLFQETNNILEEQNNINYLPSISNSLIAWKVSVLSRIRTACPNAGKWGQNNFEYGHFSRSAYKFINWQKDVMRIEHQLF